MDDLTGGGPFRPTHIVPQSGLGAWAQPDGSQPVAAWLEPGTEVRVDEWRGAWARALFSNGWEAWVDGRQLQPHVAPVVPPPPPPAALPWRPTNVVGATGLDAWASPDPALPPTARIDPGVEVAVVEHHDSGWASVSCFNGWSAWVDGRQLLPLAPAVPAGARPPAPTSGRAGGAPAAFGITGPSWWPPEVGLIAGGAAILILIGSFLPWISLGPFSASGWDVSVGYLITGKGVVGGLKVGFVLLAAVLIGLPALTHQPLPPWVVPTIGGVAVATSGITLVRGLTSSPSLSPSIGLFLTLAAGIGMLVDWGRQRSAGTNPG